MSPGALLERLAVTLRKEIGPAVGAEYPRTQAFMAAVVVQKLGQQLALAETHRVAAAADMATLVADLEASHQAVPPAVVAAIAALGRDRNAAALSGLVGALYASRAALGVERFDALLGRVRRTMRADIDRRMAFSA